MIYAQLSDYLEENFGLITLQSDLQELVDIFAPLAMEFAVWLEINATQTANCIWQTIPSKGNEKKTLPELWEMFRMETTLLETFMGVKTEPQKADL